MATGQQSPVGGTPIRAIAQLVTVTIAAAGTKSTAFDMGSFAFGEISLPAAFTGTTLTFETSPDNDTFQPLHDGDGAAVSLTVAQGQNFALPEKVCNARHVKIVSGSTEGTLRTITLTLKR